MATTWHVDSNADPGGDGSEESPWQAVAPNINTPGAGDTMVVHGDAGSARIYDEAEINPTVNGSSGNLITLRPYEDDLVCIRNSSGTGLTFKLEGAYWVLYDLEVDPNESWSYGLTVNDNHILIYECNIHNGHNHCIVIEDDATDTVIRDNVIYDIERISTDQDAHGIMVQCRADRTLIKYNLIYDCSGDCVQIHDSTWATGDDGPTDCEITDNHFYHSTGSRYENAVACKCGTDLLIANNVCHGFDHTRSTGTIILWKDQFAGTITIRDNTIYNSRRGVRFADCAPTSVVCRNNIIYDIDEVVVSIYQASNLNIHDNTFANSPAAKGIRVTGYWTGGSLQNNLWDDCDHLTKDATATISGVTVDHNGRWDTTSDADFVDAGTDTTGTGDPGFIDEANDDYHLRRGSDPINAGVDVGQPFIGSAPDLGAYEYHRPVIISSWF